MLGGTTAVREHEPSPLSTSAGATADGLPPSLAARRRPLSRRPAMSQSRAALYARVSTVDQTCENQLAELRSYTAARGWTAREFVDAGVSGAKESRPALDD